MEIAEYFNSISEAVKYVLVKFPEFNKPGKGRFVLNEVEKIYPKVNPDTVMRSYRKLRSEKDNKSEHEWREYFKEN